MFCLFVFFKQKSAYDVRISDWSSDVCSSDLLGLEAAQVAQHLGLGVIAVEDRMREVAAGARERRRDALLRLAVERGHLRHLGAEAGEEIGRASCRERVC